MLMILFGILFWKTIASDAQKPEDVATWAHDPIMQPQRIFDSSGQPLLDAPNPAVKHDELNTNGSASGSFSALLDALEVMQSNFFELWQGTWTGAIDWTAAVMGTHVSATLSAITSRKNGVSSSGVEEQTSFIERAQRQENLVNRYFTQVTSFYFGENAFSLRTQAYDDMLWVVLGWLESIKFINLHSGLHYASSSPANTQYNSSTWYGHQFIPSFAHRAHLFYDIASQGWDTSLCGGGMIWSPYLTPYKNAITNQLYIAASVSMYLYFPGDDNPSPFNTDDRAALDNGLPPAKAHDDKYLDAALEAYKWLRGSNMTNEKGLFVDGFHVHGWRRKPGNDSSGSGKCDVREEMVYTYNQGVLLSGLRGLWDATGTRSYLEDGHELIRNVIAATGWHVKGGQDRLKWAGLGRDGILEEVCDASGRCDQNGQTFKGIFFHHMTLFCAPLPTGQKHEGDIMWRADEDTASLHRASCREYAPWIKHNAHAASRTRNADGEFGMWWGRPYPERSGSEDGQDKDVSYETPSVGTDYRNYGVPRDTVWRLPGDAELRRSDGAASGPDEKEEKDDRIQPDDGGRHRWDPNNRGRGRTVETQSGGLAVLRAMFKLADLGNTA